ncbi:hypothetical protein PIB30_101138, partial [Stylosanthes scabra]|nr:hypothetical protein [Stylosanthes scabra]
GYNSDADTQFGAGVRTNIRRLMLDLNRQHKENSEGSILDSNQSIEYMVDSVDASAVGNLTTQPYLVNHDSNNDDADREPAFVVQEEDEEQAKEEEEQRVNYFTATQLAYAQPLANLNTDNGGLWPRK